SRLGPCPPPRNARRRRHLLLSHCRRTPWPHMAVLRFLTVCAPLPAFLSAACEEQPGELREPPFALGQKPVHFPVLLLAPADSLSLPPGPVPVDRSHSQRLNRKLQRYNPREKNAP